ncbi:nucleoside triphosphate pyrophosphohydrolase [Halobacillus litoralis]|uniref:nucleoside triphosphate pyrophosphohydrolase n=1 Tax=Halobacillus litoralis TaxID=45668 RepID=UPI001CFDDC5B|nr:nucleoside triphosphate pyrophosphohydrolase [Halobacillus litoralis]
MSDYKPMKLVRDNIPQMLETSGRAFRTRTLGPAEYNQYLKNKLKEEMQDYLHPKDSRNALTKLADLLEVIHALSYAHGASIEELEHIRQHRRKEHGGFMNRTLLYEIDEKE